jgi:hypothetical protein
LGYFGMVRSPTLPYHIPLTDEQLLIMGKIAVIWGQIDEEMNSLFRRSLRMSERLYEETYGNTTIGPKLRFFKTLLEDNNTSPVRDRLLSALKNLADALPLRNNAMHGCWGYYPSSPTWEKMRIGTFNHQKPKARFYVEQLDDLLAILIKVLREISEADFFLIDGNEVNLQENKIYFCPQPPDERAVPSGVWCERGDKIVRVESTHPSWREE